MCYEHNAAAKETLLAGSCPSAAVMVPCPWFNEFAHWLREHPHLDVGLHLTLTSEFKVYRWSPLSPSPTVPGLIDPQGYFHRKVIDVVRHARSGEVEKEIRAQIQRAIDLGLTPTHLDSHMGTLFSRPDFFLAYISLAREYRIPAFVPEPSPELLDKYFPAPALKEAFQTLARNALDNWPFPRFDNFIAAPDGSTYSEKRERFFDLVRSLPPGLTLVIFHPAIESEALKKITGSWQQRVWDYQLLSDSQTHTFFQKNHIIITTYRELLQRYQPNTPEISTPEKP